MGRLGAAPGLAAVQSGLLQTALAQLGAAAGASLAALPVVELESGAETETIDQQLLHALGQVCSMPTVQVVSSKPLIHLFKAPMVTTETGLFAVGGVVRQ